GNVTQYFMRVIQRRGHELGRLTAGVTKHDALIARPLVLVAGGVNALCNVSGLRMEQDLNLRGSPMKASLFVADVLYRLPRSINYLLLFQRRAPNLAGNHHTICRSQRFASDSNLI